MLWGWGEGIGSQFFAASGANGRGTGGRLPGQLSSDGAGIAGIEGDQQAYAVTKAETIIE